MATFSASPQWQTRRRSSAAAYRMSAIRPKIRITRPILAGGALLLFVYFWFSHTYKPGLASAARGGFWGLDAEDSTGLKPPYKGGAKSVGAGMVNSKLPCKELPGSKDVLVVMKTGSTELVDKFTVHIKTTLQCYTNYIVYSDFEESYQGEDIKDALRDVSEDIKNNHADFDLHRRLYTEVRMVPELPAMPQGRGALNGSELSGPFSRPPGPSGKPNNPGWKLDKWKFLPMMERTLNDHGDKMWYLFVETDTYIMWQTLLNYLGALDSSETYYLGGQIWIDDILFAHGGTGFVLSKPALEKVVHNYQAFKKEWEDFTNSHWAGDCVLGKAMANAGAPLTQAWPIFQADDIGNMAYDRIAHQKRLWCHPTVSYHHLSPSAIEDLWIFEQEWILKQRGNTKAVLTHRDVFHDYVLPRTKLPKVNWDNHADQDQGPANTMAECLRLCFSDEKCVQYRLTTDMRCMTTSRPNLGEYSRGVESGWLHSRLQKFYDAQPPCGGESWIVGAAPAS